MKTLIHVPLTPELEPFRHDLEDFFRLMVMKLHVNRHKGFAEDMGIDNLIDGIKSETNELVKARYDESQFNAALEAVDVANVSFLFALKCLQMTKREYKEGQVDNVDS
jgi:hypothetical protein